MVKYRSIKNYFTGVETTDGAGVKLRRCFGYHQIPEYDPYLLMDFFDSKNSEDYTMGFPWHPHRGIETITYLIKGEIHHEDSLGNKGIIKEGDCQWMSAGSGILHQEMPKKSDEMLGVQIWLNIPKNKKMDPPSYREITSDMIPMYKDKSVKVNIIAGKYMGVKGPISRDMVEPIFLDVELNKNQTFSYNINKDYKVIVFLLRGRANFNIKDKDDYTSYPSGVIYNNDGDEIKISTDNEGARFFVLAGMPLDEEIAWGGPIVMNTKSELDLAFKELKDNNFIKVEKIE